MRTALIVSAVLHLSILIGILGSFGEPDGFSTPAVAALPVELVTIEEETDLTLGEPNETEVVENAAPETVEAPEPPAPAETPGATGEEATEIATDENARVNAPESAAPEPAAEPVPEPVAETEPEPETPQEPQETEVAAVEPEVAVEQPAEAEPVRVPETVVPSRKPTPPPRRQTETARLERTTEDAFNADRLSQLINRTDPSGGGAGAAQASLGASDGRAAAALTLSEKDALRSQMQRCWNPPIGLAGGEQIIVAVQIRLAPDGSVVNIDQIGNVGTSQLHAVAADSARRAVLQCQPYRLPVAKYDAWKDVQVTFDPRDLF
ncbi:MAG: cell envelope biogenesis protein TolA [Pseudomonadota bacterium]